MKKRILPIGFISLLISGVVALYLIAAEGNEKELVQVNYGGQSIKGAKEYLALIRNNQHTGLLNPKDVINARKQIEAASAYKSGNGTDDLNWVEIGPDNIGGRTRAIIYDNRDQESKTLYAGSVTGGVFKSTNQGTTWTKVNLNSGTANLNVSSMVQADDGTIYVGTGEGLSTERYTAYGDYGYEGGFIGKGIFKSDNNDNFTHVSGTEPVYEEENMDWVYINDLAIDKSGNRLFAATNNSLKYASLPGLNDWSSDCKHSIDSTVFTLNIELDSVVTCDSYEIVGGEIIYENPVYMVDTLLWDTANVNNDRKFVEFEEYGNVYDVKVSDEGWIITVFNGLIYVSESGDPMKFVNRSIFPENPDGFGRNIETISSNLTVFDTLGNVLLTQTNSAVRETDWDNIISTNSGFPSEGNEGRVEFAIAPSDQNVVYAMATKSSPPKRYSLFNIYLSEDGGQNWRVVAPGGSDLLNVLGATYFDGDGIAHIYYQGDYNNVLAVFPNDPYKILAGGVNLWEGVSVGSGGYYQWTEKSVGDATLLPTGIFFPLYVHVDHHTYVFKPGSNNEFMIGTDGGIYSGLAGQAYNFQARNKNYNVTQFYSIDITNSPNEVIGGTQDNGTQYIYGQGTTAMKGEDLWRPANFDAKYPEGTDGGYVAFSNIRIDKYAGSSLIEQVDPVSFYSKSLLPKNEDLTDRIRRSETLGYDYSANFFTSIPANSLPVDINFLTPMALWECYNNENSRDSVMVYVTKDYIIKFEVDSVYNPDGTLNRVDTMYLDEPLYARSKNLKHPFQFFDYNSYFADFDPSWVGDTLFHKGDSMMVKDLVSSKFFLATKDEIWMTLGGLVFNEEPEWFVISAKNKNGFTGNPSCMSYSADANELFVGTYEGDVYRISNIALAYNEDLADVDSPNCIIASTLIEFAEDNSQVITSIAVDPKDADNVLITLGNYGNTDYLYYSSDALGDDPTFNSVQNNVPAMPVYSSLIDFKTNVAYVGTDEGLWMTDDITAGNVSWDDASDGFGRVPIMAMKQQTTYKSKFDIVVIDPVTQEPLVDHYPAIDNYGMIYMATHGRGIFRIDSPALVGIEETPSNPKGVANSEISIYPNPASDELSVRFDLAAKSDVVMSIYDLSGKLVLSNSYGSLTSGQQNLKLNLNSLTRGTYMVHMIAGTESATTKLIIIK